MLPNVGYESRLVMPRTRSEVKSGLELLVDGCRRWRQIVVDPLFPVLVPSVGDPIYETETVHRPERHANTLTD
jgi:hypothetical protein